MEGWKPVYQVGMAPWLAFRVQYVLTPCYAHERAQWLSAIRVYDAYDPDDDVRKATHPIMCSCPMIPGAT